MAPAIVIVIVYSVVIIYSSELPLREFTRFIWSEQHEHHAAADLRPASQPPWASNPPKPAY